MKRSELKKQIKEEIIEILSEQASDKDVENQEKLNKELERTKDLLDNIKEDEEPTTADLKKKDSVTTVGRKLQEVTKEMKSTLAKWKKSEGSEKEKHLERLKELTKMKKELESML
jgi:hypothetical protein